MSQWDGLKKRHQPNWPGLIDNILRKGTPDRVYVDVDFLCRSDEQAIRGRVRETPDVCLPGGGYCLGTGNSVANYIPLENYLAMIDEGRRYGQ